MSNDVKVSLVNEMMNVQTIEELTITTVKLFNSLILNVVITYLVIKLRCIE